MQISNNKNRARSLAHLYLINGLRDSRWKASKCIPLVDKTIDHINKHKINVLDVGGGAGLILNAISRYIEESSGIKVDKFALDPSLELLQVQKKNNPNLKRVFNEDICKTSLDNKEIDLTLMIDVLEHVPNQIEALKELKRISNFIILKVPLEDCLLRRTSDFVTMGKTRQRDIETLGHVNIFNFNKLLHQIEKYMGRVLDFHFTNVFEYFLNSKDYNLRGSDRVKNLVALYTFKLSPKLCSLIFYDYIMILVKCYNVKELSL